MAEIVTLTLRVDELKLIEMALKGWRSELTRIACRGTFPPNANREFVLTVQLLADLQEKIRTEK